MDNKEQCRKLANRIYELDEKVYKTSGSGLGKTFTGEKARVLDDLTMLIVSNPQGHLLRSELALIGNMASVTATPALRMTTTVFGDLAADGPAMKDRKSVV